MSITRRSFLALGAGTVLVACGGSSGSSSNDPSTDGSGAGEGAGFTPVQRYPQTSLTPGDVRLPISLADENAALLTSGPDDVRGRIVDGSGAEVAAFVASVHSIGAGAPLYWSVTATIPEPGIYAMDIEGAAGMPMAFQLFDPAEVSIPTPGEPLPAFDTPTVDDDRGVAPICTLAPDPCPFHEATLTEALASGLPVVYLVGTPAHCATGTCGPGLEFLVDAASGYDGRAVFVHAEVYADDAATTIAPAVTALATDYEPLLFITDADGVVQERLDIVWDTVELEAALARWIA